MKTIFLKVEVPDDSNVETLIADLQYGYADETSIQFTEITLPTEEEIEAYALENVLDADSLEGFEDLRKFQEGATWLLNRLKGV